MNELLTFLLNRGHLISNYLRTNHV